MVLTSQSGRVSGDQEALLLGVEELARLLKCSVRHVRRLCDRGMMPAPVRLGALLRWSRATIEDWIAAGCPAAWKVGRTRR